MIDMRRLGRGNDLLVTGTFTPVADVLQDGAVIKPGILQNHGKHGAQVGAGEILDIMAVDKNGTAVDIVEAHQQFDHGGLACSGRAHDGDLLTGFGVEGKVIDDDLIRAVPEVDVLEVDSALDLIQLDRGRRVRCFFRFGQEFEDTLGRGGGLLEDVGNVRDLRDRLRKRTNILDKGLDVTDADDLLDRQVAAQDADGYVAQVADEVHDRKHDAGQELGSPGRTEERGVDLVELSDALGFAVERLHDHMPAVHFLDMSVQVAQVILLLLEVFLGLVDHQADDPEGDRHDDQRHHGHLPADREHHDQHADHGGDRGDDLGQTLVEGLAHGIHVVGDPGEDFAVVGAVEVAQRHAVDLLGNILSEA